MNTEPRFVLSGAAAGVIGGLAATVVTLIAVEPHIQTAIDYEPLRSAAESGAHAHGGDETAGHSHGEEEVVARTVQSTAGVFLSVGLFGLAMGLLIAVAAYALLKLFPGVPARVAALIAGPLAFVAGFAVPFVKYPSNPPAIADEASLVSRTLNYYAFVAISLFAAVLAVVAVRYLMDRFGLFASIIMAGAGYLAIVLIAGVMLPSIAEMMGVESEIPAAIMDGDHIVAEGFPAAALAGFRSGSFLVSVVLFGVTTVGLAGLLGLSRRGGARPTTPSDSMPVERTVIAV